MKKLMAFFRHPITLGIIGLLAFSVVIWLGLDYVKFGAANQVVSYPVRLLVIALVVVLWLLNVIRKLWQDRQRNNKMLDELQAGAESKPATRTAEQRQSGDELKQLDKRFNDAIAVLRKTKFRTEGKASKNLYQLPWYIIIGPPGAGKTTALVNSGLNYPLAASHGKGALGGVGGTRNCDWWFTEDAVLIDTAGRYTTQDSNRAADNKAWQGFLSLLKKHRRRQPINGAIIATSLQDLLLQTPQQRELQAEAIRTRIDELYRQLGIQFPIYLLFTKCDLIAGFSEYFSQLTAAEREQVWGVTFDSPGVQDHITGFDNEFQPLVRRLGDRMLARVHYERDPQKRALIENFPVQFASLGDGIGQFIQQVFGESRYQESSNLRGVYFCSATQEGMPIDRMMASLSANFGFGREVAAQQFNAGQSYFIHRLFKEVIIPEAGSVGTNARLESSIRWTRRFAILTMTLVLGGALAVWAASMTRNTQFMADVEGLASQYEMYRDQQSEAPNPLRVAQMLVPLQQASEVYDRESHPWLIGLGLYDPSVDVAANKLYHDALHKYLLPDLQAAMEQQLVSPDPEQQGNSFETLRAYLMLADETRRDDEVIQDWAHQYWTRQLAGDEQSRDALDTYLAQLFQEGFQSPVLDNGVISEARRKLVQEPAPERLYAHIKANFADRPPLLLREEVGEATMATFGIGESNWRTEIPFLFTRGAYAELDFGEDTPLFTDYRDSRWVLGELPEEPGDTASLQKLSAEVKDLYLKEYGDYWSKAILSLRIAPFPNLAVAQQRLDLLAESATSPIVAMLELTREQTELKDINTGSMSQSNVIDQQIDKLSPSDPKPTSVDERFARLNAVLVPARGQPSRAETLTLALAGVRDEINAIALAPDKDAAAFNASKSGGSTSVRKVNSLATRMPKPVNNWLLETARYSSSATKAGAVSHLEQVWKSDVCGVFNEQLAGRFPFTPSSFDEVSIEEFNLFFAPEGLQQRHFKQYLSPYVDRGSWQARTDNGSGVAISPGTVEELEHASVIRSAFFPARSPTAKIKFQLKPIKLDATVRKFQFDPGGGQSPITYTHGPKFAQGYSWEGGPNTEVSILFEDLNGTRHEKRYAGSWALHRLIAQSVLKRTSAPGVYELTIREAGRNARFELTVSARDNPFDIGLLASYRCSGNLY